MISCVGMCMNNWTRQECADADTLRGRKMSIRLEWIKRDTIM